MSDINVFEELIKAASVPLPTPRDLENHERKIHYPHSSAANEVVGRSMMQDAHRHIAGGLHTYRCPACHHSREHYEAKGKKPWIIGHKAPGNA